MKYKVGDKVRIKTWKELEEEFGKREDGQIYTQDGIFFSKRREKYINKNYPDRIIEIIKIHRDVFSDYDDNDYYECSDKCSDNQWQWSDSVIKGLVSSIELKRIESKERINSRFDILDIR